MRKSHRVARQDFHTAPSTLVVVTWAARIRGFRFSPAATATAAVVVAGFVGALLVGAAIVAMPGEPLSDRLVAELGWARALRRALARPASSLPNDPRLADLISAQSVTAAMLLGVGLLIWAWLRLDPTLVRIRHQSLIVALWAIPMLLVPPVFSRDMYSYADQGWMFLHGYDPYVVPMGTTSSPFAYGAGGWTGTTVVYPPLAVAAQAAAVLLSQDHWYWTVIAMRLPAVLGVALLGLSLPALARRFAVEPRRCVWFGVASPLVLLHGVAGGHNDMLMVGVAALALAVAARLGRAHPRRALVIAGLLAGVATAVKQPAAVTVLAVASMVTPKLPTRPWLGHLVRSAVAGVASLASFGAISVATGLGVGWLHGTGVPGSRITAAVSDVIFLVWERIRFARLLSSVPGLRDTLTTWSVVLAVILGLIAWWRWSRREPVRFAVAGGLLWALLGGSLRIWYLLWAFPLLLVARPRPWVVRALVALVVTLLVQTPLREYAGVHVLNALLIGSAGGLAAAGALGSPRISWESGQPSR